MFIKSLSAVALIALLVLPVAAHAQCELPTTSSKEMSKIMNDKRTLLQNFLTQEKNYTKNKLSDNARVEIVSRLEELQSNVTSGLSEWWNKHFHVALKDMTKELHRAKIEQTIAVGKMLDAQMTNETLAILDKYQAEARKEMQPSDGLCQMEAVATEQTKSQEISTGIVQAWSYENQVRGLNTVVPMKTADSGGLIGTAYAADNDEPDIMVASAAGKAAERREMWKEYRRYFCNPSAGDQGCILPGRLAGQHIDIPNLLWGNAQTIDMSNKDVRRTVEAAQRYLIMPSTMDPIPSPLIDTKKGEVRAEALEQMLRRRSHLARINTIYNTVGNPLAERVKTSKINLQSMRTEAGIPPGDAATEASYREIQEAMNRDRFQDPEFLARMVADPKQLIREQGAINTMKMQQMNDLYKRLEELVFMETALYADDLDSRMPQVNFKQMNVSGQ